MILGRGKEKVSQGRRRRRKKGWLSELTSLDRSKHWWYAIAYKVTINKNNVGYTLKP